MKLECHSIRDPRVVSCVFVEPPCDVAPMPLGSRSSIDERGSVPASSEGTYYKACDETGSNYNAYQCCDERENGISSTGVVPEELCCDLGVTGALDSSESPEPSELSQFLNEKVMPIGSRSCVEHSGVYSLPFRGYLYWHA